MVFHFIEISSSQANWFLQHTELLGGHNFCRNPGNQMGKPWCFVDDKKTKMVCNVKLCGKHQKMKKINKNNKVSSVLVCLINIL